MSEGIMADAVDESWPMVEEAVFRLFDELAGNGANTYVGVGQPLAELGFASCCFALRAAHWSIPTPSTRSCWPS
jgi:hypothetical protein